MDGRLENFHLFLLCSNSGELCHTVVLPTNKLEFLFLAWSYRIFLTCKNTTNALSQPNNEAIMGVKISFYSGVKINTDPNSIQLLLLWRSNRQCRFDGIVFRSFEKTLYIWCRLHLLTAWILRYSVYDATLILKVRCTVAPVIVKWSTNVR